MKNLRISFGRFLTRIGIGMRAKLIIIFLLVKVVPIILLTAIAWRQITLLGDTLQAIAVSDTSAALNDSAVENIERMTTDTALRVADFLYGRDSDILFVAAMEPSEENYRRFALGKTGRLAQSGEWQLAEDGQSWEPVNPLAPPTGGGISTNSENNDMDGFHYRAPEAFTYRDVPLYDEITFVGLDGVERIKITTNATKVNYPLSGELRDVSQRENTYVKAEGYFEALQGMRPGDIYVSDVIGAYVGTNYIGMYTPDIVAKAAEDRGYDIPYLPQQQAYSGAENPQGQRFEGIVRWATPVAGENGEVIGYVTLALNHDHIMEFVDHQTPMNERYTELPSAYEGNYAFIWDYNCRSICHPRHHSITGYDPETGEPEVPWLESSIYDAWQASGVESWYDFVQAENWPAFDEQSRQKTPAPALTQGGLVGLDGRYLNNAPQCTGWMDLTRDGGSGSFYILWSGLYKLTTAAAIPYYTGQYAPSEANDYSRRGFGFVAIGAGLEDFTAPATEMEERLGTAIEGSLSQTSKQLMLTSAIIILLVVLIAIWIASSLTGNITHLIKGISRYRGGERQFRFNAPVKDEFGTLADSFDDMADSIDASVKNPLTITDLQGRIIYMNEYGLAFYGDTALEEMTGKLYSETSVYLPGSPYDPIAALQAGRESEILYVEAQRRYIKGNASYFLNKDGRKIGYIIETLDVTDMVEEQLKIEEQRTLLDKVLSSSPDLIWYMDTEGRYLTVNPRFSAIAGKKAEECIGKTAEDILPRDIAKEFSRHDRAAAASGEALYSEDRIVFADAHEEILESVRTPIYDANGTPVGLLGFARNVTARVNMEEQLRRTQLDLEKAVGDANRANEHKGEFLARMSHEIRTPMNAIIGITNIVQKRMEGLPQSTGLGEVESLVGQIEASSQHLLGLLNDILDISKIEAGKIELTGEVMELPKLADTVATIIRPRCEEKNITFLTRFDKFDPAIFRSDSLRLRQVLINLLGNAVKFTPECGTVEFRMKNLGRENGSTHVEFVVRDNGIGISPEAQEAIFQPFEQASGSVARRYGGTGLGLAISQRIVELFGGKIALHSEPGHGSTFRFAIWLRETSAALPHEKTVADASGRFVGKRLLVVDDVDVNRMIVASMLEGTGVEIEEANDGLAAVHKFESSPEGSYDMILMDVQMPGMDGYEASMAIRAMEREDAKTVPIVALTANAFKEDMDRALAHGMNAHVAKPIEMDTLLEMLFRFFEG